MSKSASLAPTGEVSLDLASTKYLPLARQIADHVVNVRYEDLPAVTVRAAKRCILDTWAVAWAGAASSGCPQVAAVTKQFAGYGQSRVWSDGSTVAPAAAAVINGMHAAALDYDSLHEVGVVHSNIVVLPAAIAMAEQMACSGRELLTAFVVGDDLVCRLGKSLRGASGWFNSSICGVFGAAAASARILGLSADGVASAFGVALSHVSGTQQPALERRFTKRMQSAFASQSGLDSALLASCGISAPREPFEGRFGLFARYEEGSVESVLDGLGLTYAIGEMTFKKFPSCACNHAAIEATLQLVKENSFEADDVVAVDVTITEYMNRLVGAPYAFDQSSQIAAQFSVQYSIAACISFRRFGVKEISEGALFDLKTAALCQQVRVHVDQSNSGKFGPATVIVSLRDGRRLVRRIDEISGGPNKPMTEAEFSAKLSNCFAAGAESLSQHAQDVLAENIEKLETLADVRMLLDLR